MINLTVLWKLTSVLDNCKLCEATSTEMHKINKIHSLVLVLSCNLDIYILSISYNYLAVSRSRGLKLKSAVYIAHEYCIYPK